MSQKEESRNYLESRQGIGNSLLLLSILGAVEQVPVNAHTEAGVGQESLSGLLVREAVHLDEMSFSEMLIQGGLYILDIVGFSSGNDSALCQSSSHVKEGVEIHRTVKPPFNIIAK